MINDLKARKNIYDMFVQNEYMHAYWDIWEIPMVDSVGYKIYHQ